MVFLILISQSNAKVILGAAYANVGFVIGKGVWNTIKRYLKFIDGNQNFKRVAAIRFHFSSSNTQIL